MDKISLRYNKEWYDKRINQNSKIQKFLIKKINEHKEKNFPWTSKQLSYLKNEDLAEIAVATVNKKLNITLGKSQDYSDGSDTKCVINQARNNIIEHKKDKMSYWTNSYTVPGLKEKTGPIRVVAYNTQIDDFEFFYFPKGSFDANRIEIILEQYRLPKGQIPKFTGVKPKIKTSKWYAYKCKNFEEMSKKT